VTYSLRFNLHETHKRIYVYLLGRLHTTYNNPQSINQANILLSDLERMLESFGFESKPLNQKELEYLAQNSNYGYCFEVCQEEVATSIRLDTPVKGETNSSKQMEFSIPREFVYMKQEKQRQIYGIRPWWGAGGTFLVPFNALASQNSSVSVCILLTPTQLNPTEQNLIAEIARQAESLAQQQTRSISVQGMPTDASQNKTDPQLRWESRLYAANLRRLNHPFLSTIFCFSNDPAAAQQVAVAIASTIREEQTYDSPLGESEPIASGAKVLSYVHSSPDYYSYITKACHYLDFTPFLSMSRHVEQNEKKVPHPSLRRLRYLMDGRGAACAFRFPVSVQGGVPGIPVKQRPPDFHPGERSEQIPDNAIDLGRFHVGGRAYVSKNSFTKHALITGFTGSGKSNTCLYLLDQFWRKFQIPFLVIESAKKEYRGLRNVDIFRNKLLIYTLGNETVSPLRFNPFELIPGVRVESHLAHLQTCFEGALPPVGPLPSVISEALEVVYQQYGWRLIDRGRNREDEPRLFPTMEDFYKVVEEIIESRGYQGEVKSNVEAAIKGRVKPLLMGSKGKMFSSRLSNPNASDLFQYPVILELNDLNEQDKSLVMMFFLTLLREYRELHPSKDLTHITLVEEAHNVLANVDSVSSGNENQSDVKAKSVQAFCNMLAEVRAYGEGLIIADQSPEKLARDAMRNTNVQIAHQLRDAQDREAIANAMIMSEEQRDFLGKCETGRAAVFYTGLQKATFIDIPVYKDKPPPSYEDKSGIENLWEGFGDQLSPHKSDEEVLEYMQRSSIIAKEKVNCSLCDYECQYREQILHLAEVGKERFKKALDYLRQAKKNEEINEAFNSLAQVILEITNIQEEKELDLAWCYTKEMWFRCKGICLGTEAKEKYTYLFKCFIS
ncbi:ATP-binding protein, partial [Geminocystis sp. CENA526]|uniref:ATP-binding protein n=1 Tax=Geminocystis sp. CENA526 TaxID=1355871 RepID=UPI003D6F399F